ncbi:MAG: acriflavin resistance protein [Ignavibacteria bacterium CG22_combo_CG10-13_8_21_14_all_37_15]|nr:efflux RND transporter permease subunit [Ignavibacteria bacterium]OIO16864.1 MAG: acriflavin resistance protein [Ignavibacteria bacterium CG1_02_37_35]PIP76841.1 MAG: acriflavin resistance protein [Ignavibacteria bacterium CG22_combo_CG10-13_8_21_14_all_37_15]PIS45516.1 MAG: acriflavin resistance protein [Ignavibacteria bacterium CG08_land_8_20_14_0_20_37_9]PIX94708.1 MAG: acriflavin resistance protein [Ignavibacteria bacterium CG_4_10_14_3_um_filter_37_18]PJC60232.1 MAG: acriflavin resista
MSLSSLSIRRPVLAIVMSIVILLFGIIGYTYLGVREYPSIDPPIITVSTSYVGANADIIESQITEPLEEQINGIAGIRSLTSVSRDGRSQITVEFDISSDLETAANDVRDRVSIARSRLPQDVDPPTVSKADADAVPIVFLNVKSDKRTLLDLSDIAQNTFKERLQTIPGVSQINIWGEKKYSMRLWMDPSKLAAYNITPIDVRNALNRENIELPSGSIEGRNTELTVRTLGRLTTVEEFNNLIIKEAASIIIRFKDIGNAELYPENDKTILRRDGIPMVGVVLIPQPGANFVQIADEFYKRLDQIKKDLPEDIELGIGFDVTKYIRNSISEVEETIILAFALVILIIFLFLRDWRTTLIPIIAIPVSLIGAFFIMYLAKFSINTLTLLGIVLAIGIVVDDAIVVLENIYKKVEQGMTPVEASTKGATEIFFAIVSTTITLAAVFLPIMFLKGITGRLFVEFGVVIAGSVLISAFVALTLTPMLSSKILRTKENHSRFYYKTEPFFVWMEKSYQNSLNAFMEKRWLVFVIMSVATLMIYVITSNLQSELAPIEDRSELMVRSTMQEGTSFNAMDKYILRMVEVLQDSVNESEAMISLTGGGGGSSGANNGFVRLTLTDAAKRKRTQTQIAEQVTGIAKKMNDGRSFVIESQSISTRRSGLPVQYIIQAPNFEKLRKVVPKFLEQAQENPTFANVDVNLKFNKPEIVVEINRTKARELGISAMDIAQTLQLAYSGQRFGFFIMNGKQYSVIGQVLKENRNKPVDLTSLNLRNNRGESIQLDNLVTLKERSSPPQLYRFNRYVSATVSASLAPGKTIGDGIAVMDKIAKNVLDETFSTALDGASKDFVESSSSLFFTFMLALVLIYLILAAQFESFRDPLIIMFTVPLAIAGAAFSLWYFNQTLNIFSEIGQIMLIGLVTKNGILIVEFANQKKAQGLNVVDAVKEAARLRLRPILMTSFSTVLGTLPIALALGAGSGSRVSMGIAVIGGLIFSTILTLYVIPGIYSYFSEKTKSVSNAPVDKTEEELIKAIE